MLKQVGLACVIVTLASGSSMAQTSALPHDQPSTGSAGSRSGNVTSTGETVPNPGASQSAGTTPTDRGIMKDDNAISNGICKGC